LNLSTFGEQHHIITKRPLFFAFEQRHNHQLGDFKGTEVNFEGREGKRREEGKIREEGKRRE
jgi:hypothetical protein